MEASRPIQNLLTDAPWQRDSFVLTQWNTNTEENLFASGIGVGLPPFSSSALDSNNNNPTSILGSNVTSTGQRETRFTYRDHMNDPDGDYAGNVSVLALTGGHGGDQSFPVRLHYMLNELEKDGLSHIVSWQPHGRCFLVHDQKKFVDLVLGNWFRQSKYPSFQRQLNIYGFQRLTAGPDKGGYYHELFLRSKPGLAARILRQKLKGTGTRKAAVAALEPNFYRMSYLPHSSSARLPVTSSNFAASFVPATKAAFSVVTTTPDASPTIGASSALTLKSLASTILGPAASAQVGLVQPFHSTGARNTDQLEQMRQSIVPIQFCTALTERSSVSTSITDYQDLANSLWSAGLQ
ncbi:shock factor protein 4 [Seminavis robusta]|uniref:Shock factor protein 4 n=1 Tax=Seminavis robusta TaxID=568900 RepID=A0A9N8GZU7_9STRA|nr:shock factor protein 4 [Seminavis robusta]|eukprot:Sro9_g007290.1 shock factor protein 4 (351) ;mRNA; f:103956-105341